jgi:hypothetical protein
VKLIIHKILAPILGISGVIPPLPTCVNGTHVDNFYAEVTGENSVTRSFIIFILYRFYYVHQQKEGKTDGICNKYRRDKVGPVAQSV